MEQIRKSYDINTYKLTLADGGIIIVEDYIPLEKYKHIMKVHSISYYPYITIGSEVIDTRKIESIEKI